MVVGNHAVETMCGRGEITYVHRRPPTQNLSGPGLPNANETIRILKRERAEHSRIDDAEDCGVGADAKRQRGDPDGGKAGVLRIVRPAYLRSCNNESIKPNPPMLRVTSLTNATLPNSRRAARAASSGASPRSILCLVSIARWA